MPGQLITTLRLKSQPTYKGLRGSAVTTQPNQQLLIGSRRFTVSQLTALVFRV